MPVAKISISLSPEITAELVKRADTGERSGRIDEDLSRYYEALARSRKALRTQLSAGEVAAIVDICNGTLHQSSTLHWLHASMLDALDDGIAQKWEIDGEELVEKLRSLSYFETAALVDAAERYWQRVGKGEQPDMAKVLE